MSTEEILNQQTKEQTEERPKAAAIADRMSKVRAEIGEDVEDVVESSKSLTDWKEYVRANPMLFTIGAAVLGYVIVPRKIEYVKPDTAELVKAIKREKLVVAPKAKVSGRNSLAGSLMGMVVATATRAAATHLLAGFATNQSNESTNEHASTARRPK